MQNREFGRRIFAALLLPILLLTLTFSCLAASYDVTEEDLAGKTLDGLMTAFMEENGLNETNFSLCYYNTVTGEEYCFNETHCMVAASTYKLPLNMYYYELEASGELDPATWNKTNCSLEECHYQSIVLSNNEISHALLYGLGTFRDYKNCMRKYFTMTDEEIEDKYYQNNFYCTRMMMDALKYLYEHSEDFPELLDLLKQALPREEYFLAYIDDVEIAHKYGDYEGANNDVGIIYTEQPFLLAVYTQGVGSNISGKAAKLLKVYTEYQTRLQKEEQERIAAEQAAEEEAARLAAEQAAAEEAARLAAEQAAAEEAARLAAEQAAAEEAARLAAEQAAEEEAARLAAEQAAQEEASAETVHVGPRIPWALIAVGAVGVGLIVTAIALGKKKSKTAK